MNAVTAPRISVVIPACNAEASLPEAIDSVLAQSLRDIELILIDDGSRDGTLRVMQAAAARDARVRVVTRENRGLVHTLNEGVALARGEWVARMDADDICRPERLALQLRWAERQQAEVCGGWIRTFGGTLSRERRFYQSPEAIRLQLLFNSCFAHPAVLARRAVLLAHPYDPAAAHAEDYDLWCRLAAAGVRLTNYPGVVLDYRLHAGQITATRRHEQDAARARIAATYRAAAYPQLDAAAHAAIMSRLELLPAADVLAASAALGMLIAREGNPEGVLADNRFLFLARHAEAGPTAMRRAMAGAGLGFKREMILMGLALMGAHQHSRLFNLIYGMR